MATESVIRRIQGLFSLAGNNPNEAEAAAAMDAAQKLLAKHNLDMAILNEPSKQAVGEGREKRTVNKSAMYRWQQELWATIAESNFCWHFITHEREAYNKRYSWGLEVQYRKVKRHRIVGRQSNVIAVQLMGEYLCETIEKILPYPNAERLSNAALSWRQGCSDRLRGRIVDAYTAARKQDVTANDSGNMTALALVSVSTAEYAANYDFMYGEGAHAKMLARSAGYEERAALKAQETALARAAETPAQRKAREAQEAKEAKRNEAYWERARKAEQKRIDKIDGAAYAKGHAAGSKIGLDKQVSTTDTKELM